MILKCEKCGYEPPSRDCPACGETAPRWAGFCPHCGAGLPREAELTQGNRRLCPDGNCIGILDESGRCVICGLSG
jgi:predicted amidophosphoribosyltransferase